MGQASEVLLSVVALHGRCGTSERHLVRELYVEVVKIGFFKDLELQKLTGLKKEVVIT